MKTLCFFLFAFLELVVPFKLTKDILESSSNFTELRDNHLHLGSLVIPAKLPLEFEPLISHFQRGFYNMDEMLEFFEFLDGLVPGLRVKNEEIGKTYLGNPIQATTLTMAGSALHFQSRGPLTI